jgi:hypothetical protein
MRIGVRAYVVAQSIPDSPDPAVPPAVRWVQPGAVREALAQP